MSLKQPWQDSGRAEPSQPEPADADRQPGHPSADDILRLAKAQSRLLDRFIQEVIETLRQKKTGALQLPPLDDTRTR